MSFFGTLYRLVTLVPCPTALKMAPGLPDLHKSLPGGVQCLCSHISLWKGCSGPIPLDLFPGWFISHSETALPKAALGRLPLLS